MITRTKSGPGEESDLKKLNDLEISVEKTVDHWEGRIKSLWLSGISGQEFVI